MERYVHAGALARRRAPLAALLAAGLGASASAEIVYSNNFESSGWMPEWTSNARSTTPISGRTFLGEFNNDAVRLNLGDLTAHTEVTLSFDFYAIRTWDGNTWPGPDNFAVRVVGGDTILDTTFVVSEPENWRTQSYPAPTGQGEYAQRTGAVENNTLGYTWKGIACDAVWHMDLTFAHTGPYLALDFIGSGLQPIDDESWGLDNVQVSVNSVPAPGALALAGLGAASALRRKRR
ncbi:MAG: hypothetical protein JNL50_11895 [Phycisphaerae bacterium]|nr:hypothetical protein [Phycisphaerae bacterium]